MKGSYCWSQWTEEGYKKGIQYFNQAIRKDPGFAMAYAGLASCYNGLGSLAYLAPGDAFPQGKAAAKKLSNWMRTLLKPTLHWGMQPLITTGIGRKRRKNTGARLSSIKTLRILTFGMASTWIGWDGLKKACWNLVERGNLNHSPSTSMLSQEFIIMLHASMNRRQNR
jgi:hypothetical protein